MKPEHLVRLLPDIFNGPPPAYSDEVVVVEWGRQHPPEIRVGVVHNGRLNDFYTSNAVRWAPLPDVFELQQEIARLKDCPTEKALEAQVVEEKARAARAEQHLRATQQLLRTTEQDDLEKLDVITAVMIRLGRVTGVPLVQGEGLVAHLDQVLTTLTQQSQSYYEAAAVAAGLVESLVRAIHGAGLDIEGPREELETRLAKVLEVLGSKPGTVGVQSLEKP